MTHHSLLGLRAAVFACLIALFAEPASAQGLNWFYCYAPNAQTGVVHVSNMHEVGPVSERAGYGAEFANYLTARGKLPRGAQAYCVMRATEREIAVAQRDVTELCAVCNGASIVESVAWARSGSVGRQILASDAPRNPATGAEGAVTSTQPATPTKDSPGTVPEGVGVFLMGRLDASEVVYTANEQRGQFLTRYKADLKGGRWTWILLNDTCPGWVAVAFATNGSERLYFVARGSEYEGSARAAVLREAEPYAARQGPAWITGIRASFHNSYTPPSPNFSRGVIDGIKNEVRRHVVDPCAPLETKGVIWGVRG